jgi:surface protein
MAMLLTCLMANTASLTMAAVIDLATTASPYTGSTADNTDDIRVCGHGQEQGFSYALAPGHGITIWKTSNSFDSMHTLRHGGQHPGEVSIACIEDPKDESQKMDFTNEGVDDEIVYFIVVASRSGEAGAFTLEWRLYYYMAGQNQTEIMTHLSPESRPRLMRILNVYEPLTDFNIRVAAKLWVGDESSANSTYGPVHSWDLSQVTTLEGVWIDALSFNGDISKWNVSQVTNMNASKSIRILENDFFFDVT